MPWNKQTIKTKWCGLPKTKSQQGSKLTKYTGSIYAYVKKTEKTGKSNDEKRDKKEAS